MYAWPTTTTTTSQNRGKLRSSHLGTTGRATRSYHHHVALLPDKVVHVLHVGLLGAKVDEVGQVL